MAATDKLGINVVWWPERERVGVGEYVDKVECLESPSKIAGKKIRLLVNRRAVDFDTNLQSVSEIPPQFHEALTYKVISMGYSRGENINPQLATYFEQLYRMAVKEGKKYAKRRHLSSGMVKPVDF